MRPMSFPERAPIRARLRDALEIVNTPFRFVQDGLRFPRSEARYRRRVDQSFERLPEPLLVYSAPKTASTAVADAVSAADAFTVLKVHNIRREHSQGGAGLPLAAANGVLLHRAIQQRHARDLLRRHEGRIRVISIIREPIGFNVSNFTYFGRAHWLRTCWRSAPWMPAAELGRRFLAQIPINAAEAWWNFEYAPTIGTNPVNEPFDASRGWTTFSSGRFDAMVMRADIPDDRKTEALRAWLPGIAVAQVVRVNENDTQAPRILMDRLAEFLRTQPAYVDRALALPMVQRFWTAEQRAAIRARWLG